MKVKKVKVASLTLDTTLYPRLDIDRQHVGHLAEALAAGAKLPPIIVWGNVVIDGFHRTHAVMAVHGDDADIGVVEEDFKNKAEAFKRAMELNAVHGRRLDRADRMHSYWLARGLKLKDEDIAHSLNVSVDRLMQFVKQRSAKRNGKREVLKRTIEHMAGRNLSKNQAEANDRLGGMTQVFYVNQVLLLIENDLIDLENEKLMARLEKLYDALKELHVRVG
jgi:hypothetical protein